jgi:hypothetical protein
VTQTTTATGPEQNVDSSVSTENQPVPNLGTIGERLQALLGPTDDLGLAMSSFVSFPPGVRAPADAEIIEVSIGAGSPTDEGTTLTQVAVSLTTSLDSITAFNQISDGLQAVGMRAVDSTGDAEFRSASFRVPAVDLFEEIVVTVTPSRDGSTMRLTSNSIRFAGELDLFLNWADGPLPLPDGTDERTLIVLTTSGSDRLRTVNLTVESTSLVRSRSPQREANRLISNVEGSDRFGFDGEPSGDQPLTGSLSFDGLDTLTYSVVASSQILVGQDGEPAEVEVVEVSLSGLKRLQN